MIKKSIFFMLFTTSLSANAHCPALFKPENLCLMLDENVVFVYDKKGVHSGPYKDFTESSLIGIKSVGQPLKYAKVARGVYRIESSQKLKKVEIEIMNAKKKTELNLSAE